jgi:ATP-dependent Clp protease, protease subunit
MPKSDRKREPIRCFDGDARPGEPFWNWRVRNANEEEYDPELEFYGYISEYSWWEDDITPKKFKDELYTNGQGGPITIRINSGGGEVVAASVIRSILSDYPGKKTVRIDGMCASAAVAVALAGDEIQAQDTAYMMIHNPMYSFFLATLNAEDMLKLASELEIFKSGILDAYQNRTGLDREELSRMCTDETWMTAAQAKELGFIDEVISAGQSAIQPGENITNQLRNYHNVPSALLNAATKEKTEPDEPQTDPELERMAAELREEINQILQKE